MDYLISDTTLDNIATAIREKTGKQDKMTPVQMPDEIRGISGGGEPEPLDDGKTRLYITVPANSMEGLPPPRNQVPLYIKQTVDRGVTIDWGDGSDPETLPGTGNVNTTHIYQQAGDYVISLDPADGCELGFGDESAAHCIMGNSKNNGIVYCNMLKKIEIGSNVTTIDSYAFQYCYSLSTVIFSNSVRSIGNYTFGNCYGMKEYHLLPTTPPSISNANVLQRIPDDCTIYVPIGSLEAYKTATNWSTYAEQMQEEPS